MIVLEVIMLITMALLGISVSASDLKQGMVYNKTLMIFLVAACIEDLVYYAFFVSDLFLIFVLNVSIVAAISLALFYTNSFAGGDCKLAIVMSFLYPARLYLEYGKHNISLFIALGMAIFLGYVYLVMTSLVALINGKNKPEKGYFLKSIIAFLKTFAVATIYITFISLVFSLFFQWSLLMDWIMRILCIAVAWRSSKSKVMNKWYTIGPVLIIDIIICVIYRIFPLGTNIENYLMIAVLLICQMTVRTNLYEDIPVLEIKKGMILSMGSSLLMQNSRVRSLPGISSEDLKSRLTEENVNSIQRWAQDRKIETITIVKKIPFAVFIVLGFVFYILVWGLVNYEI